MNFAVPTTMETFSDNFSKQSDIYKKYRPDYPVELFDYLATLTPSHGLAWDAGTGNGQAALGLTSHFASVYATDPSAQQIDNAYRHDRINYKVEKAEQCSLGAHSTDLITVALALHWFDFSLFYAQVKRVLKPNGIIAAWAYGIPKISPEIDALIHHIHDSVVGELWQEENRMVEKEYTTIPFPFDEIKPPEFFIRKNLSKNDLLGLVRSWSATQKYIDKYAKDPIPAWDHKLTELWDNPENTKAATWKLVLKIGKVSV